MENETNMKTSETNDADKPKKVVLSEVKSKNKSGNKFLESNYTIISDLKLEMEAVVGNADMTVKELFDLQAGSVVALNQSTDTAIVLKFDGKPVATGALVVVGDNFGIQVTEIINTTTKLD